jgi:hypothetical protein
MNNGFTESIVIVVVDDFQLIFKSSANGKN